MKKSKYVFIIMIFLIFCLYGSVEKGAVAGKTVEETISMTDFYNGGTFGSAYQKAHEGTIVTISDVGEMKIFLNCLYDSSWTSGVSFRQEADISFGNYTFAYDFDGRRLLIYRDGVLLGHQGEVLEEADIQRLGLADACVEVKLWRNFLGQYDGQGHSISGFILIGSDSRHNGIFGHVAEQASISRLKIKGCFLNNACGTFCGYNEGTITDCSAEYILGTGWNTGGIAESNGGTMLRCRLSHGLLYSTRGWKYGGIVASSYGGMISDCAAEHLQLLVSTEYLDDNNIGVGGIAGYQTGGKISNCASFCEALYPDGVRKYTGGIVGCLDDDKNAGIVGYRRRVKSEISNCISAGRVSGGTAGGIVGKVGLTESVSQVLLKNNLSLAEVEGGSVGGVAGELNGGQVVSCYSYAASNSLHLVGQRNAGSVTDCHAVNREQVYGEASADVIDAGSIYSNTKMLLEALNNRAAEEFQYLEWKMGAFGYPILASKLNEPPGGDYVLGSEIRAGLPYKPGAITTPLPTHTPGLPATLPPTAAPASSSTGLPNTFATPDPSSTGLPNTFATPDPSSTGLPNAFATPLPSVTPEASDFPSVVETVPPFDQDNQSKQQMIKNLSIKRLKVKLKKSLHVELSWNESPRADGYHILRSSKGSSHYKIIGKVSALKSVYIDKTAKRGHTYYYMVRGYADSADGVVVYGNGQKKKVKVAWYRAPVLGLRSGKNSDGKTYVQVRVSKYSGSYIEVYFKRPGQDYVKAPLKNKKIAFYNGKLRFSYKTKSLLYCKARTYQLKKGKKYYSAFAEERAIQL